jgi:hemerythrin-like domain-containing protein
MISCLRAACDEATNTNRFHVETFQSGLEFIRAYADAWHHAKEEDQLFPAMEAAGMPREGGPIGVMLQEHVLGRSYVSRISEYLDAAAKGDEDARIMVTRYALAYAQLLTQHIQKENNILFNIADQMFSPEEHEFLEKQYQLAIPKNANQGSGRHYERLVIKLCQKWNLDSPETA